MKSPESHKRSIEVVSVAGGEFPIGSEGIIVHVDDFAIAKYPTTNEDYAVFLHEVSRLGDSEWRHPLQPIGKNHNPQYWETVPWCAPRHPVVGVDWWDAWAYAKWVGGHLPTEIQWEAAAAGPERRMYPWGMVWDPANLNSQEKWGPNVWRCGHTTPVDGFPQGATPCGIYDMAGNVWEWTMDTFHCRLYQSPPPFDGNGTIVIKGGSFRRPEADQKCWARDESEADCRGPNNGFRCVFNRHNM